MSLVDRLSTPPPNTHQPRIDRLLDSLPQADREALDNCLRGNTPADWLSEQILERLAVLPGVT